MATTTGLTTVADFEKTVARDVRQELRHGEVITMPPASPEHFLTQVRLVRALQKRIGEKGLVWSEISFRPVPEHNLWIADVAFLSRANAEAFRRMRKTWTNGVPDLVIEVLSPSNTAQEIEDREEICLRNGGRQFWTVNLERKTVKVSTPDGKTTTYRGDAEIDLAEFGGGTLNLSEIFEE